jgi:hypothetical protein
LWVCIFLHKKQCLGDASAFQRNMKTNDSLYPQLGLITLFYFNQVIMFFLAMIVNGQKIS